MMIINLMKKLIERVEVAVKVAKILIEKQNQQKTPSATVIFFFQILHLGINNNRREPY